MASEFNRFYYSTDGINWTEGTMPSEQNWRQICYGNAMFVTITGYAYSASNIFAYSHVGLPEDAVVIN